MNTELQKNGTVMTAKPEGRLDTVTSPEFDALVRAELEGVSELILDMEKLEYISSGGLRVLLSLHQDLEAAGGSLKLTHINEYIVEVFELTGFLDFLKIE